MSRTRLLIVFAAALLAVAGGRVAAQTHTSNHLATRHAPAANPVMGTAVMHAVPTFVGYYDGHKDTYVNTDTSSKAEAGAMHINYSAALAAVHGAPSIYLVQGAHVARQIAVFGSEPGESDYSPLWQEVIVRFKSGAKPVLLTSDNQINSLAKKGTLTAKATGAILNCPVIKVGK